MDKFRDRPYLPIANVWISSDKHYGFLEFKEASDIPLCQDICKLTLMEHDVKIGKTKNTTLG